MNATDRKNLITAASKKIWSDFLWIWRNLDTEYASSEFVVNKNYSIFAFEESDEETREKWITITLERYNDAGRCVNDFVVTAITSIVSPKALTGGIRNLINSFEKKVDSVDVLELTNTEVELEESEFVKTHPTLTDKDLERMRWLFTATDFSNAQIGRMFDVSAVTVSKIRNAKEYARIASCYGI